MINNSTMQCSFILDNWSVWMDWKQSNAPRILDPSFIPSHASRFVQYLLTASIWINHLYLKLLQQSFTGFCFLKFHNKTFNIQNAYFTYGLPIALPLKCSQNVVLLSDGVHAHVILIWKKVCWPNHTSHSSIEGGTLQWTL